ncbi:MAG: cytochrome c oxidase subunit II [Candidatus Hydrogenedentes bacterium]|nr:cytochrome c oxidase subunit II [Candidatus Hydrogenedentota bacterium]
MATIPLIPEQASTISGKMDFLFYGWLAMSMFFFFSVVFTLVYFCVKYRKGTNVDRTIRGDNERTLELTWTIIPLVAAVLVFFYSAYAYIDFTKTPQGAMEILVTGKQWMWKIQHPTGKREINALHVPIGVPVKLTMTSEDTIHSFFIPAFRVKKDVLPNRFSSLWFNATKEGEYHLFCTEYCGTDHSRMVGTVTALTPERYQAWLAGTDTGVTMASSGEKLFTKLGCVTCHTGTSPRGPTLKGVFGKEVKLNDGSIVVADEEYLRESILNSQAKLVAGYPPLMPLFRNQIKEQDLMTLINYIKSLKDEKSGAKS